MSTALTTIDAQVPAHLHNPQFLALQTKLSQGLSTGAPPRVSFKSSRYRLIAADGVETLVNENNSNGTTLDVIVLDANPSVSKFYYDQKYDPNAQGEDAAPACFSEDGTAPSARSLRPQSRTCAACPKNAWGSKISDSSGKKIKACSDYKKLAVIPVNNLAGDAYVLGIPGASLKAWSGFVSSCAKRNYPVAAMVIRLGFNAEASYPELTFTPTSWVSEPQMAAISDLLGSPDMASLVGVGDAPHGGPFALEATQGGAGAGYTSAPLPTGVPHTVTVGAPVMAQPVAAAPMAPPPGVALPPHTQAAMAQAPAPAPVPQAAPAAAPTTRRRGPGRPPAAAAEPAAGPIIVQQAAPVMAAAPIAQPLPSVATTAAPSADMNALLDQVMQKR